MAFTPRFNSDGMQGSKWWYTSGSFPNGNPFYPAYGLPNCTCYAYGRAAEIMNAFQNLPTGNATDWFSTAQSMGWETSQEPTLGAIMCWSRGAGETHGGHVCVVEEIQEDGTIITSNSAWQSTYFYTVTYSPPYVWGSTSRNYYFAGFIVITGEGGGGGGGGIPDVSWHGKESGGYERTSIEAQENALNVYKTLNKFGYTLNAVAAVLGNIEHESAYNVWRWESEIVGTQYGQNGYGLIQYTPAQKYILSDADTYPGYAPFFVGAVEPSPTDGEAQLYYLEYHNENEYYATTTCPESYTEFKTSILDVEYLVECFMRNYERPASYSTLSARQEAGLYWYNFLQNYDPGGGGDVDVKSKKSKCWMWTRNNIL